MAGRRVNRLVAVAAVLVIPIGCRDSPRPKPSQPPITLQAAGATFPARLYAKWFEEYERLHAIGVHYDDVGSGTGTDRFLAGSVDFAASDAALTDQQIQASKRGAVVVPITAGIVALAYQPGLLPKGIRLSRDVYVDIFLGRIRQWNDPRIVADNPGRPLPDLPIHVVTRSDASGTTYALTNHLAAMSQRWREGPGVAQTMGAPSPALRARGNAGMAAVIRGAEGAIGYVELGAARSAGLAVAWLQNKAGKYIEPNGHSGLATLVHAPPSNDLRMFVPDPEGEEAYPIVTYTWLLLYEQYDSPERAAALKELVRWCLTEGQQHSESLHYIRLSPQIASAAIAELDRVRE